MYLFPWFDYVLDCRDDIHHVSAIAEGLLHNGLDGGEILLIEAIEIADQVLVLRMRIAHFYIRKVRLSLIGRTWPNQKFFQKVPIARQWSKDRLLRWSFGEIRFWLEAAVIAVENLVWINGKGFLIGRQAAGWRIVYWIWELAPRKSNFLKKIMIITGVLLIK